MSKRQGARPAVREPAVGNPRAGYPIPGMKPERSLQAVYVDGGSTTAWRAARHGESKVAVVDGMGSPMRQPTVPPSVEALRSTAVRNFEHSPEMQMAGRK